MDHLYRELLTPFHPLAAEKKTNYSFLTERHIQALWFEQKYFKKLQTSDHQPIHVISPGIWNLEAGPDFRKAHLKIGNQEYFGDVEIHLSDDLWKQHGHHRDSRYDNVVLHISLWHSLSSIKITTSKGTSIYQGHLEDSLTLPINKVAQVIDLEIYPYKKFVGNGQCADTLFKKLSDRDAGQFFERAAEWRLQQKNNFFLSRLEDLSLATAAGIAIALGYKNNSEQFFSLFLEMQKETFTSEKHLLAWLLERCGFFTEYFQEKWGKSSYYKELESFCTPFTTNLPFIHLHLHQIRPLNHPVRRLALLSKLHFDPALPLLKSNIYNAWDMQWQLCHAHKKWKPLLDIFKSLLLHYDDPYWNTHFLFEEHARSTPLTLMGDELRKEIVVNLFLPLLYNKLLESPNPYEIEAFQQLYRSFSASKASKRKYLVHRFFGDMPKGEILNSAYTEQGAYQLHYDFCSHFEASCEGCPFVNRYKNLTTPRLLHPESN